MDCNRFCIKSLFPFLDDLNTMLQLIDVQKTFQHKTVVNHINLTIQTGKLTALLGASGSGKSTLLNIITGLLSPDCGEIRLNGQLQNHLPPEKRQIAMMFQDFALLPHLNVWQNATFGLRLRGMDKKTAYHTILPLLDEVGLTHAIDRSISQLSGGEKQRVALARALAGKPKLLLLDEPFSSLDTHLRAQLQILTRYLIQQYHIPAILVTHDPDEACFMADDLALLVAGEIVQHDLPESILSHPQCAQVAQLMGCLNVGPTYYVPQNAILLNHPTGEICPILSCLRQSEYWRITLQHHQFGPLTFFHATALHHSCRITIDYGKIITFISSHQ